jgi:hypothetical protein
MTALTRALAGSCIDVRVRVLRLQVTNHVRMVTSLLF